MEGKTPRRNVKKPKNTNIQTRVASDPLNTSDEQNVCSKIQKHLKHATHKALQKKC